MTRKDYIAGLEEIRKSVKEIGQAFAAVDLTDATNMESDRRRTEVRQEVRQWQGRQGQEERQERRCEMSLYNPEVKIDLVALVHMRSAAEVFPMVRKERDELKKACAEYLDTINDLKARLAEANNAAGKLRKELDEKAAIAPEAFPKMSEDLAQSFDRATNTIKNAENPPPPVAKPDREMILDVLKDIVHNVAAYFTKPQTTEEEPF